jgi:hypothetical protein
MRGFSPDLISNISNREIDVIIAYLKHMAGRKVAH